MRRVEAKNVKLINSFCISKKKTLHLRERFRIDFYEGRKKYCHAFLRKRPNGTRGIFIHFNVDSFSDFFLSITNDAISTIIIEIFSYGNSAVALVISCHDLCICEQ